MPKCIDLRERFGKRYRVKLNRESYMAEPEQFRGIERPWHFELLCQHGQIVPWGGDQLAACTNRRSSLATRLAALTCVTVIQDAEDGINATFDVADFPAVAKIMRPRRRRQLTEAQRQAAAERLRQWHFTPEHTTDCRPAAAIY